MHFLYFAPWRPQHVFATRQWAASVLLQAHHRLAAFILGLPSAVAPHIPRPSACRAATIGRSSWGKGGVLPHSSSQHTPGELSRRWAGGHGGGQERQKAAAPLSHVQSDSQLQLPAGGSLQRCVRQHSGRTANEGPILWRVCLPNSASGSSTNGNGLFVMSQRVHLLWWWYHHLLLLVLALLCCCRRHHAVFVPFQTQSVSHKSFSGSL